jgi:lactoylglutathione lyase
MATVTGFYHAGIVVRDMETSLRFYRNTLGLEVLSDRQIQPDHTRRVWGIEPGDVRMVLVGITNTTALIELNQAGNPDRRAAPARPIDFASGHVCLYVDDLDAMFAKLHDAGYGTRSQEVVTIPVGPSAGHKSIYALDPDGYSVELYERRSMD